ncbi:hypothetical protein ABFS83_08G174200 [Erythranthe nasuta]
MAAKQNNICISNNSDESRRYNSTWQQRAWFACGCATLLISLAKSMQLIAAAAPTASPLAWLELAVAALVGYAAADLGSGIFHWAVDNYGTAKTPVFGPQIESFRAHHQHPSEITKCETAGVLYVLAAVTTVAVLPFSLLSDDAVLLVFVVVFAGFGMFSLKFHAWAHTPRRKLPPLVAALQDAGIILRWSDHAKHHRPPFDGNYCTVSGVWNRVLDEYKVFAAAEAAVFRVAGVRPRSWSEPNSDWSQIRS